MKTYQEIKKTHREAVNKVIEDNGVFFAFSQEQLKEGLATLKKKGDKIVSIGAGGFLPKSNADKFFKEMGQANDNNKKAIKELREEKQKAILYELNNYECFHSGDIEPVVDLFKGIYTEKAILKVYNNN